METVTSAPCREDISVLTADDGIFSERNIRPETLDKILENSAIVSYKKGDILYAEGDFADNLPLFVILSGEFEVWKTYDNRCVYGSTDKPGELAGDIEFFSRDVPVFTVPRRARLTSRQTWSKRICARPGSVLRIYPCDFIKELEDSKFAFAIARSLAIKLLFRAAKVDTKIALPRKNQVVRFLWEAARERSDFDPNAESLILTGSLGDFAEAIGCSKQTVANAFRDIAKDHPGFEHITKKVTVPRSFWLESPEGTGVELD